MELQKNKKIAILTSLFLGKGGTERAVINLANNFAENGLDVTIISVFSNFDNEPVYYVQPNVKIIHIEENNKNKIVRVFKLFFKLKKQLNHDIYIGVVPFLNILLALYSILRLIDKESKIFGCEHTSYFSINRISRVFTLFFYRFLDKVITLTEYNAIQFHKNKIKNTCVIPNAVSFWSNKLSSCTQRNILSVGRLSVEKNFSYLIENMAPLLYKFPDWCLTIVGEGEKKQEIINQIMDLKLEEQIILKNFTPKIEEEYENASIFVLTSIYEGFPMVLLEAKSCGLPIVAHDCISGPKEIIKDDDGILTSYLNGLALQDALQNLIVNDKKRIEMGRNAYKNVKEFSKENIFKLWEKLF